MGQVDFLWLIPLWLRPPGDGLAPTQGKIPWTSPAVEQFNLNEMGFVLQPNVTRLPAILDRRIYPG